jgi:GntR family transcriptional regulator
VNVIETSKTHRLYLLLKEQIVSGALPEGCRLPSEPRLASEHSLSRVTVRRALEGLAREGLIVRQAGSGTFVNGAARPQRVTGNLTDMLAHLGEMGRSSSVRLLAFAYVPAPQAAACALGLSKDAIAQQAIRVRAIAGTPFSHLTTYVPEVIGRTYSKRDLGRFPLLTLLERSGVAVARADQTISATLAGPDVAAALGVAVGAPLLALTRVVFDQEGRGVEHLSALYRPDMHCIRMEMTRAGRGRSWTANDGSRQLNADALTERHEKGHTKSAQPGRKSCQSRAAIR